MRMKRVSAALAAIMMCASMVGASVPVCAVSVSDTMSVTANAEEGVMKPLEETYTSPALASREAAEATAQSAVNTQISYAKNAATFNTVKYRIQNNYLIKRYYQEIAKDKRNYKMDTKLVDGKYITTVSVVWAEPYETAYTQSKPVEATDEVIQSKEIWSPLVESDSLALKFLNEGAEESLEEAYKAALKKYGNFDEQYNETGNGEESVLTVTKWNFLSQPTDFTKNNIVISDVEIKDGNVRKSGYALMARKTVYTYKYFVQYRVGDTPSVSDSGLLVSKVSTETKGTLPFCIKSDYHKDGLDFTAYYDGDVLEVKVFNKESDKMGCNGPATLPGIGIAKNSSAYPVVKNGSVEPVIAEKTDVVPEADKKDYSHVYEMSASMQSSVGGAIPVSDNMYSVVIKDYDLTPVVIGDKKISIEKTNDSDKPFKLVVTEVNSPATDAVPTIRSLSDFTQPFTKKASSDASVYYDTTEMPVSVTMSNSFYMSSGSPFDFGDLEIMFRSGNKSNAKTIDFGNIVYAKATTDGKYVDYTAKNEITGVSIIEKNTVGDIKNLKIEPTALEVSKNADWKKYALTATDTNAKQSDVVSIQFRPTNGIEKDGDAYYLFISGTGFKVSADTTRPEVITVVDIKTLPKAEQEAIRPLLLASAPKPQFGAETTKPTETTVPAATESTAPATKPTAPITKPTESTTTTTTTTAVTTTTETTTTTAAETTTTEVATTETTAATETIPAETTTEPVKRRIGDVNNDGEVDIMDVIRLNKFILGTANFNREDLKYSDITFDGSVGSEDSLKLLKYIVGIITREQLESK